MTIDASQNAQQQYNDNNSSSSKNPLLFSLFFRFLIPFFYCIIYCSIVLPQTKKKRQNCYRIQFGCCLLSASALFLGFHTVYIRQRKKQQKSNTKLAKLLCELEEK